ncbi:MAG TPA: hypothetical protein DF383_02850, partial [Deltaproteobacteria bacterium]|nr:hypothetical protein [Deltaproteobacteria bacterium]
KIISQEMAVAWCKKMEECAPDKSMTVKECEKILYKSFKEGFDRLPKEQPIQLEQATFEECKANVAKGTCDSLKTAKALPACEFIGLLGK